MPRIKVVERRPEYDAEQLPDSRWVIVEINPTDDEPWTRIMTDDKFSQKFEEV